MISPAKPAACLPFAFALGGVATFLIARNPSSPVSWAAAAAAALVCVGLAAYCSRVVAASNAELLAAYEQTQTFRAFFQHAPVMCHILDAAGRYVEVNEAELKALDRGRDEVVGRRPRDFQAPTDREGADERWSRLVRDGQLEAELCFVRRDGTSYDTLLEARLIRDAAGNASGSWGVLVDITERKRLLQQLEEARAEADRRAGELEAIFDAVGEAILFLDRAGHAMRMNRTALQIAGRDRPVDADMSGWTAAVDLMDADGRPITPEQTPGGRTLVKGETVRDAQMRLRRKADGRDFLITVTSVPMWTPEGTLIGAGVAFRDIGEIDRVRRELQQSNEELRRANRFKTEFLANMSHELRTPLNAVIGFGELLRDRAFGPLNEKQAGYVSDILASAQHLLRLISDVLDLTKIEAGRITIQPEKIDLVVPFSEALALVKPEADARKLSLAGQAVPGQIDIYADPVRVRQVLLNLLSNAIKFTPEGGRVELDAEASDGWVTVRVSDSGVGIDPADFARIFEPFEQLEPTLTRHTRGAGLGLTISKKLVELHGGSIWVESRRGAGSAFCFRLPRDPATFQQHAAAP